MFDIQIDTKYIVNDGGTSDGTQVKYLYDNKWYKLDRYGGEGVAEYIGYIIEKNSNLNPGDYVPYEMGHVNGKSACRSDNFIKSADESFISIYRLFYNVYGKNIAEAIASMELEKRVQFVLNFVEEYTGLDIREYLANTFTIDSIILNEDRHFNNLGLISGDSGFRPAPIFDNGKSLLVGNVSYNRNDSMEEKVKKVIARPFSGSFKWQEEYFSKWKTIKFDIPAIIAEIEALPDCHEKDVVLFRISTILGK